MYLLPLPELIIYDVPTVVRFIKSRPNDWWYIQPCRLREETPEQAAERKKTLWCRQSPGDRIHDMIADQFAIPYEHFEERKAEVHLYRLIGGEELFNHKDRSRIAIIFCSLDNYDDTILTINRSGEDGPAGRPAIKVHYTDCPLLLDGYEWHGVKNHSKDDRISISVSFHEPYTFDLLEEMYKNRELLKCQQEDSYRFPSGRRFWNDGPLPDPRYPPRPLT